MEIQIWEKIKQKIDLGGHSERWRHTTVPGGRHEQESTIRSFGGKNDLKVDIENQ